MRRDQQRAAGQHERLVLSALADLPTGAVVVWALAVVAAIAASATRRISG